MSTADDFYNNATGELFSSRLKAELNMIKGDYENMEVLRRILFEYVEV